MFFLLSVIFGFLAWQGQAIDAAYCARARYNCKEDVFLCRAVFGRFATACDVTVRTNMYPPTPKPCSKVCLSAISILKSTKKGKELFDCDCNLGGDCLVVKARIEKCFDTSRRRRVSCTRAWWNCTRDPTCCFLKSKFLDDCRELFNSVRCEKCLRIEERLFEHSTYGRALKNCECDGSSEAYCRGIKAHAQQLRCMPGMDGNGKPGFTYYNATGSGDGEIESKAKNHTEITKTSSKSISNLQSYSIWMLVLIAPLFLL